MIDLVITVIYIACNFLLSIARSAKVHVAPYDLALFLVSLSSDISWYHF